MSDDDKNDHLREVEVRCNDLQKAATELLKLVDSMKLALKKAIRPDPPD
jgi:hypothetical protein